MGVRFLRAVIVDADSHVLEPADLWTSRLDASYRDRGVVISDRNGVETLEIGGNVVLQGTLAGLGGVDTLPRMRLFDGSMRYADGCPPASYDAAARLRLYDEWGIDAGIVFPTIGILPFETDDLGLLNAMMTAYNTWQAEFAADGDGRIIPIATLNLRDRDAAIAELDRCLDLGFRGVFMPPEPIDGRLPGDPWFDPLWERCAEAGVPLCFHVVVRFSGTGVPFEGWLQAGAGMLFGFGLGSTAQLIPAIAHMALSGVFDRIPALKTVAVEAGCGWAPYLMDRLDEKHAVLGEITAVTKEKPSHYLRTNVWYVAEPEERTIGSVLDLVGEDRVLWGSDYPHIDSTLAAPDQIRASVAGLSVERQRAVLGDNAQVVFGLG
jgi:predicted TIM-barrel fold metal-dependent hydrolase